MVHDYLGRLMRLGPPLLPANLRAFAEAYYVHYPKVAIGHWPPLFYAVQAIWMFVFGRTKTALLLLMLSVVAVSAIVLWDLAGKLAGNEWGTFAAAAIFLLLPVTQQSLYAVMPDAVLALLACAALAIACNAHGSPVWLWVVAISAVLVHFRGAPLLVLVFIAMMWNARTQELRGGWIVLLAVSLLAVLPLLFIHQTTRINVRNVTSAAAMFPVHMLRILGPIPFAMAVLGAWAVPYRKKQGWLGITALVLATWLFFSFAIVPWEDRYLMIALPACILLMTGAWQWLATRLAPLTGLAGDGLLAAVAVGTALTSFHHPLILRKPNADYQAAVRQVLDGPDGKSTVFLVAGNPNCEGAFIAGVDLADSPGRHLVLRSSKVLAKSDWTGRYYSLRFGSPEEVAGFLAGSHISVVVIESTARPDVEMLEAALRQTPSWLELPSSTRARIYRRTLPLPPGPITVRLDMQETLRRSIEWTQ